MSVTCCEVKQEKFYQSKLFMILIIITIIITASYFIDFLNPVYHAFMDYLRVVWWAILLGLLIGGLIDYFVPHDLVENLLGKNEVKSKKTQNQSY